MPTKTNISTSVEQMASNIKVSLAVSSTSVTEGNLQNNVPSYYMATSFVFDEEKSRNEIKTAMEAFGLLLKDCSALVVWRLSETVGYEDHRGLIVAYGRAADGLYKVFVAPDGKNCAIETVDSIMRMEWDMEWKEEDYTPLLVEASLKS